MSVDSYMQPLRTLFEPPFRHVLFIKKSGGVEHRILMQRLPRFMQQTDLLTSLPPCLACIILQEWLTLKSVIQLDTSYCSNEYRKSYLALLLSNEYFIRETVNLERKSVALSGSAGCFCKLGNKIRSLYFSSNITAREVNLVVGHCYNLTKVLFNDCISELRALLQCNEHIETLQLHCSVGSGGLTFAFSGLRLPKLRVLAISRSTLSKVQFMEIGNMSSNIVVLELSDSKISQQALQLIPKVCPQLRNLGLAKTQMNDETLDIVVSSCLNIVHLDISCNSDITDMGIRAVAKNLKGLQSLNLMYITEITDASLVYLYTHCANKLHTLHVYSVYGFGEAFHTLLLECTQLRTLHYSDDVAHPVHPVATLPNALHNLTTLVLSDCAVNAPNLVQIGKYGVNLEVLSIFESGRYSNKPLMDICMNCTKLKEVYIELESVDDTDDVSVRNTDAFALLALTLWKRLRPGLEIHNFPSYSLEYDVLDM